ncbi:MAG: hypothetical protein ABFE13_01440 [Phycisphaerales bacterium]
MGQRTEHEEPTVQHVIEGLAAHLAAYCVASGRCAVLIVRQDDGFVFRRSVGPHGAVQIPEYLDDSLVLARFRGRDPLDAEQLQAIDEIVQDARARGERVVLCPADGAEHQVRIDGPAPPAADSQGTADVG